MGKWFEHSRMNLDVFKRLVSIQLYSSHVNRQGGLSLAFNGGKDCTVLLHLFIAALFHRLRGQEIVPIQSVYVTCRNPFPEVDSFVELCVQRYRLDSVRIPAPMRQALQQFLDTVKVKPKAILVGIRRNDPYAGEIFGRCRLDSVNTTACLASCFLFISSHPFVTHYRKLDSF